MRKRKTEERIKAIEMHKQGIPRRRLAPRALCSAENIRHTVQHSFRPGAKSRAGPPPSAREALKDKSQFVERFLELSLFYGLSSPLNSEMICIFPYF